MPFQIFNSEGTQRKYTLLKKDGHYFRPVLANGEPIPFTSVHQAKAYAVLTWPELVKAGQIGVGEMFVTTEVSFEVNVEKPEMV